MTAAKIQHYVPQFLLRNFSDPETGRIWVYDKTTGRTFPTNTKNVASESRFYDFQFKGQTLTIETWLSDLEGRAKSALQTALDADSVAALSNQEKHDIASFLSVQLTRTRAFREDWNAFPKLIRERLQRDGDKVAPGSQVEQLIQDISENDSKEQTAKITVDAPRHYAQHFLDKDWVLAAAPAAAPFLLSDNPLTRQNMNVRPHRGNLGLTTPGIEIYMPLSPTRALALWCKSNTDIVHRGAASIRKRLSDGLPVSVGSDIVVKMSEDLNRGAAALFDAANVENFNSLQVVWSERYIFSQVNDFQLVEAMLEQHPTLRAGPRSAIF